MHSILNTYHVDGFKVREHEFSVPLDYTSTEGEHIRIFARELSTSDDLPWLVYFQGGPGFAALKPSNSGWLKAASNRFRILLLDQRGTGRSQAIHASHFKDLPPQTQAERLKLYRADNIVRDAELIRTTLGVTKWSSLGQSFGGFCTLSYLSFFPNSLERCFVTGGMAGIFRHIDDVYRACYQETESKNKSFFEQYPNAQTLCTDIANYLYDHDVRFSNGQRFTVTQFQAMGIELGRGLGKSSLYAMIEDAFSYLPNGDQVINDAFLIRAQALQAFTSNPIYAILHEAIYCEREASNWSAQRMREELDQFNWRPGRYFLFTGEMVFPSMFEEFDALKPLKEAAHILAFDDQMNDLYRPEQLANNKVPVYCAVYNHDMYVPLAFSRETIGRMSNVYPWYTSDYEHDGLSSHGETIFNKLAEMARL